MNWDTFHLLGQKVNYRRTHFLEHPFDVSPCFTVCVFFADQQPHVLFSLDRLFFHCGHPLLEVCSHHMEFATYVALCCFADWAAQTSVDFSAQHMVTVFRIIQHTAYHVPDAKDFLLAISSSELCEQLHFVVAVVILASSKDMSPCQVHRVVRRHSWQNDPPQKRRRDLEVGIYVNWNDKRILSGNICHIRRSVFLGTCCKLCVDNSPHINRFFFVVVAICFMSCASISSMSCATNVFFCNCFLSLGCILHRAKMFTRMYTTMCTKKLHHNLHQNVYHGGSVSSIGSILLNCTFHCCNSLPLWWNKLWNVLKTELLTPNILCENKDDGRGAFTFGDCVNGANAWNLVGLNALGWWWTIQRITTLVLCTRVPRPHSV